MDSGMLGEEGLGETGAVDIEAVPQQDDGPSQMPFQVAQKRNNPRAVDVAVRMKAEGEMDPIAVGGHAQGCNGRYLLVAAPPLQQDGRTFLGSPTSPDQRSHQEARLIQEDQPGLQPCGFFLIRGQSFLIQPWIRSSSRSTARRWGRWGLQPSERRSRPI